jgi:biotin carboxylase
MRGAGTGLFCLQREIMADERKNITCIASEFKGSEFLEECQKAGWHVTLVTREKLVKNDWPWTCLNEVKTVVDDAQPLDYVQAITDAARERAPHRVVGLDEFDVLVGAQAREHLQLGGLSVSQALRFRDKLFMRNIANEAGIPCPDFTRIVNIDEINRYVESIEPPWIVKPRYEVSAFGIRKVEDAEQLWSVLQDLDSRGNWRDHPSQFILEKFIAGDVFHVDSVVKDGVPVAFGVSAYGVPPMTVSHQGGVFSTSICAYDSPERKDLEEINRKLISTFGLDKGVTHAEFLRSKADGKYYLLEVACRVGGAYIANVLDAAAGFNLWREWAKLEIETAENPYTAPEMKKDYAGVAISLANTEAPDTSAYTDPEIVYRVSKPRHVGLIVRSEDHGRVKDLLYSYTERFSQDFLAVAPVKERYDD